VKLGDIYNIITDIGMEKDPRGKAVVKKDLLMAKKKYDEMPQKDKELYDIDRLEHPYTDTRIIFGEKTLEVKTMLVGIDMEVSEVLLADRLRDKGQKVDLIVSHHPEGKALAAFYDVMHMQADILNMVGVPISIAESLLSDRIKEVERKVMPANHMRAVDAARLLDIAFLTAHTPADNCVATYLQNLFDKKKPETLGDILDILLDLPEYRESARNNCPPKIIRGNSSNKAGKIFVDMTGGTEGSKNIFGRLSQAGVSTIVCMHLGEEHFKKAQEEQINVVIAGHIASDTLGLNLLLDELEKKERFKILTCSGFRRFSRRK